MKTQRYTRPTRTTREKLIERIVAFGDSFYTAEWLNAQEDDDELLDAYHELSYRSYLDYNE